MEVFLTNEFLTFYLVGIAGMLAHWMKRYLRQGGSNLLSYLFKKHPRYTLYALLTYTGAAFGLVVLGTATDLTSMQSLALAFTAGYTVDSAINKDLGMDEEHARVRDSF